MTVNKVLDAIGKSIDSSNVDKRLTHAAIGQNLMVRQRMHQLVIGANVLLFLVPFQVLLLAMNMDGYFSSVAILIPGWLALFVVTAAIIQQWRVDYGARHEVHQRILELPKNTVLPVSNHRYYMFPWIIIYILVLFGLYTSAILVTVRYAGGISGVHYAVLLLPASVVLIVVSIVYLWYNRNFMLHDFHDSFVNHGKGGAHTTRN